MLDNSAGIPNSAPILLSIPIKRLIFRFWELARFSIYIFRANSQFLCFDCGVETHLTTSNQSGSLLAITGSKDSLKITEFKTLCAWSYLGTAWSY